jgi:hypothetical protein
MPLKSEFANRISYVFRFRRRQFDREPDAEMRFHIETRADELEWSGLARERALIQARREFGRGARAREETRAAWQWRRFWFRHGAPPAWMRCARFTTNNLGRPICSKFAD